jgi:riboflavin synthase
MFTGLIEAVGTVRNVRARGNYQVLQVKAALPGEPIAIGESIDCDGACLTVVSVDIEGFSVEASQETVERTIVSTYRPGAHMNIERALRADSRLGGHLVAGHIDCVGTVDFLKPVGESWELSVKYDTAYDPYVVEKGSVAVNGISLTVNGVRPGWFSVNVIPHTIKVTTIGDMSAGSHVNLEFDLIGKYIAKQSLAHLRTGLTVEKLIESGW